jgi:hypothetical protein
MLAELQRCRLSHAMPRTVCLTDVSIFECCWGASASLFLGADGDRTRGTLQYACSRVVGPASMATGIHRGHELISVRRDLGSSPVLRKHDRQKCPRLRAIIGLLMQAGGGSWCYTGFVHCLGLHPAHLECEFRRG